MTMLLSVFNNTVLTAALAMMPPNFDTPQARVMLLSIGLQESELCFHIQCNGPAHGLWQFERSGVIAALSTPTAHAIMPDICAKLGVPFDATSIYQALPHNDVLAAIVARLLLWADRDTLPALGDSSGAYSYYLANWRPGKPRPHDWPINYAKALSTIQGGA